MSFLQHEIDTQLSRCSAQQCDYAISFNEVLNVVHALKHNKHGGFSGLPSEHIFTPRALRS